ncbi:response regulator [Cereibacter sp. SYSU M97828]|nr:response regulator [Cereibacter flavus]
MPDANHGHSQSEVEQLTHVVLIVEDEPLLRLAAIDMVDEAGFSALSAANATEALLILEERQDIRIVLTDVDMPGGVDGVQLAAMVRDRWPPISIIVVSGHRHITADLLPDQAVFFDKPYDELEMVREMHRLAA